MGYLFNLWTLLPIPQSSMASRRLAKEASLVFDASQRHVALFLLWAGSTRVSRTFGSLLSRGSVSLLVQVLGAG